MSVTSRCGNVNVVARLIKAADMLVNFSLLTVQKVTRQKQQVRNLGVKWAYALIVRDCDGASGELRASRAIVGRRATTPTIAPR